MGSITSYARARAESLGMQAKVGIAERADRLVAILAMTGLAGIFDAAGPDPGHARRRSRWPAPSPSSSGSCWSAARPKQTVLSGRRAAGRCRLLGGLDAGRRRPPPGTPPTFGYLSGWRLVRLLPERRAHALFRRIARRDLPPRRRRRPAAAGQPGPGPSGPRRATTSTRSPARRSAPTCATGASRSGCPSWPIDDVVRRTRTVDEHHLRDAYAARPRGASSPLPHMGNWDWAGAWACATGMPLVTVAERLQPERLYDEFVAYRNTLGMEILPLTGGDAALPRLEEWVRGGGLVCLLADRDLSRTGVEVDAVRAPGPGCRAGRRCSPARTGAPLLPVDAALRRRRTW